MLFLCYFHLSVLFLLPNLNFFERIYIYIYIYIYILYIIYIIYHIYAYYFCCFGMNLADVYDEDLIFVDEDCKLFDGKYTD